MRTPKIERKTEYFPILGGEIKATNDAQGIVEGYLNYIGNIDFGDDRTMKGAFQKTLKVSYARKSAQDLDYLWPYLWNHNYDNPLLVPGGIFDADEDHKGLYIKVKLLQEIQIGRELYASFKARTITKQSMGYIAQQVDWVKEEGRSIRNLLEVEVKEGSAVVFPMNDLSQVNIVKNGMRSFFMKGKIKQESPAVITTKDYASDYAQVTQQDWVSDLWNLWYPFRNAMTQAFAIGDRPAEDVDTALEQFGVAVRAYVQQGIALNMTEYLQPDDDESTAMPLYMSADDNPETKEAKAGRVISAANHTKLTKAADGIHEHVKAIKEVLKSAATQRAADLQGYPVYSSSENDPTPEQKQDEQDGNAEAPPADMHTLLDDLVNVLHAQNSFRGI